MAGKHMLTTGEIGKYCGVHFRTVNRWIEQGEIKACQLPRGGHYRITITEFLNFLRRNDLPIPAEFQPGDRRVLIIEDEASYAEAIHRVLRQNGFETRIASDGFEAGSALGIFKPALITLDLKMACMDGFAVLRHVHRHPEHAGVKILVVSALSDGKLEQALQSGADDILSKPFENSMLLDKVFRLIGPDRAAHSERREFR